MRVTVLSLAIAVMTAITPSWATANDREIAQAIAQQIYASGQLQDYKVMVKYADGTAYIKGEVQNQAQVASAIELAKRHPNVNNVVNMVTVNGQSAAQGGNMLRPSAPPAQMANAPRFRQVQYNQPQPQQRSSMQMRPVANVSPNHHLSVPTPPGMPAGMQSPQLSYPVQQAAANQPSSESKSVLVQQQQPTPAGQPTPAAARSPRMMPASHPGAGRAMPVAHGQPGAFGAPVPSHMPHAGGATPVRYDQPHLPSHAWPSYAAYPNYAAVTYPKQYSAAAWPYIGPFYPYPQVPLGWRKVSLEWDDGWWFVDFKQRRH